MLVDHGDAISVAEAIYIVACALAAVFLVLEFTVHQ